MTIFAAHSLRTPLIRQVPRALLGLAAAASLLGLSACGGGTQAEKFAPSKIVSFGDESSSLKAVEVLNATDVSNGPGPKYVHGQKYGVNLVTFDTEVIDPVIGGTISLSAANKTTNTTAWGYYPLPVAPGTIALPLVSTVSGSSVELVNLTYQGALPVAYTDTSLTPSDTVKANGSVRFGYGYDCYTTNKLWIQIVAAGFNKGYKPASSAPDNADGCPADPLSGAVTYAVPHALVSGGTANTSVRDQVTAHKGELDSSTLVTMMAGQNDVVAAYKQGLIDSAATPGNAASIQANAVTAMKAKGQELGQIINEITQTGARVAFVTLPDLRGSPLVVDAGVNGNPEFMRRLIEGFNRGLTGSGGVIDDGHKSAVAQPFAEFEARHDRPDLYGVTNAAWCDKNKARAPNGSLVGATDPDVLLYCSTLTSVTTTLDPSAYLWADESHMGPAGHALVGSLVFTQVTNNPL